MGRGVRASTPWIKDRRADGRRVSWRVAHGESFHPTQVFAKPSQPQKGNWVPVEVKVKFIQVGLVAGWRARDAVQGGTTWPRGAGSPPQQRAGSRGGGGERDEGVR